MITFNFNGIDFSQYLTVNDGIEGRGLASSAVSSINIPRRNGSVYGGRKYTVRNIIVPFTIAADDGESLRDKIEEVTSLLHTDKPAELVFSDEADRTYYAVALGNEDIEDVTHRHGQGTITFFCNDPVKYGDEKMADFVDGAAVIQNRGTLPAKPLFRAEVLSDITYMDVFTDAAYMRIGQPPEEGVVPPEPLTQVFDSPMTNLTGWTSGGTKVDGGVVDGAFATEGGVFYATDTGAAIDYYHGPAVKQSVPNSPHTDFLVEFYVKFPTIDGKYGRAEVYFLDDLGNAIGKFGIVSRYHHPNNKIEVRIGGGSVYTFPVNYYGGNRGNEWDDFDGVIRMRREGNVYDIYIADIDPVTRQHRDTHSARFVDHEEKYTNGNLSQVQLHIASWGEQELVPAEIKELRVWQINDIPDTDPRIIARAGDTIEIDHKKSAIFINGESRQDLKDFGAKFFSIGRGDQAVLIEPRTALDAEAIIKEEYL